MRSAWPLGSIDAAAAGGLEHAELRLELGDVAAEGVEGLADAVAVEAVARAGQIVDRRQGGQPRGATLLGSCADMRPAFRSRLAVEV